MEGQRSDTAVGFQKEATLALKSVRKSELFVPVVRPALQNFDAILMDAIDEPVDGINSPAPIALKIVF